MRAQLVLFAIAFGLTPPLNGQQRSTPAVSIRASSKGEVPADHSAIVRSAMCDGAGNVYSRPYRLEKVWEAVRAHPPSIAPGEEPAGNFLVTYALPNGAESGTFFLQGDRVPVPVASKNGELYVVEFAHDGSVRARTRLELNVFVDVLHLAVFESGEFLVVGLTGSVDVPRPSSSNALYGCFCCERAISEEDL